MAQASQANAFDASSSQIHVEHDKKGRQFVIRLNGESNLYTLACQLANASSGGGVAFFACQHRCPAFIDNSGCLSKHRDVIHSVSLECHVFNSIC